MSKKIQIFKDIFDISINAFELIQNRINNCNKITIEKPLQRQFIDMTKDFNDTIQEKLLRDKIEGEKQNKLDEGKTIKSDEENQIKFDEENQIKLDEVKQTKFDEEKQIKSDEEKQIKFDEEKQTKFDEENLIKFDKEKQIIFDEENQELMIAVKQSLLEQYQLRLINMEYNEGLINLINKFIEKYLKNKEENKIFNFKTLLKNEKVLEKYIKQKIPEKLKKLNILIMGSNKLDRIDLINALSMKDFALDKEDKSIIKKYENDIFPFLNIFNLARTKIDIKNIFPQILNNQDENENIHCIFYCLASNKIIDDYLLL